MGNGMTSLLICGDVVNFHNADGLVCSDDIAKIATEADCSVCNFEAPISGFGRPQHKTGPHITQVPATVEGLKSQGFDLLLLANNHIMDYGPEGMTATMERISAAGLGCMGAGPDAETAYAPLIKSLGGLKIGMVNACEAQFGVLDLFERDDPAGYAWINHPRIDTTVLALKKECDFVIVFAHAGLEFQDIPQKEWRARYRHLCDLGADVVAGSHPHVPQGYEEYGNALIFYSLGNFYFHFTSEVHKEYSSYSVRLDLKKGKKPSFTPIYHYMKENRVHMAPPEKKIFLERLCKLLSYRYNEAHDEMSMETYEKLEKKLIASLAPEKRGASLKSSFKSLVLFVTGRAGKRRSQSRVRRELQLLHLLRNEAYYYAIRHALECKLEKGNPIE